MAGGERALKVFVFDLDGTILMDSHNIHPSNLKAINLLLKKAKVIVFASGRMLPSVRKLLRRYFEIEFPIIAYNGSVVWTPQHGKIMELKIEPQRASQIVQKLRSLSVHRQAYVDDKLVVEEDNEHARAYSEHSGIELTFVDDLAKLVAEHGATKLLAIAEPEKLDAIIPKLRDEFEDVLIFKSFANYLDFVPSQTDKGRALRVLAEKLGFDLSEAMAFGDNDNDIALLKSVGLGVAVRNGTKGLKEVADVVVEENFLGGPGNFLLELIDRGWLD
jgi:Cof subfamily protein (haloacid dehalogenase superfamily)